MGDRLDGLFPLRLWIERAVVVAVAVVGRWVCSVSVIAVVVRRCRIVIVIDRCLVLVWPTVIHGSVNRLAKVTAVAVVPVVGGEALAVGAVDRWADTARAVSIDACVVLVRDRSVRNRTGIAIVIGWCIADWLVAIHGWWAVPGIAVVSRWLEDAQPHVRQPLSLS